jgi:large subunit ribosomal protein L4
VIDSLECEAPKTKLLAAVMAALSLADRRTLLVTAEGSRNVYLSGRNIKNLRVLPISGINAYDVLRSETIVLGAKDLVPRLEQAVSL